MAKVTEEEIEIVRRGARNGLSGSMIAARLGRSRNSVMGIAHRAGITLASTGSRSNTQANVERARSRRTPAPKPAEPPPPKDAAALSNRRSQSTTVTRMASPDFDKTPRFAAPKGTVDAVVALKPRQCRYMHGDPINDSDAHFCDRKAVEDKVYCEEHEVLCHTTPEKHRAMVERARRAREGKKPNKWTIR